jgi:hypothetical protein
LAERRATDLESIERLESRAHKLVGLSMQILEDSLMAEGIDQWLRAANRLLDGRRPIDRTDEGDIESVRQAAQAFLDGA